MSEATQTKIGRNDPCPCGSGLKHKHCHGNEKIKAMHQELVRMKTLAHVFLCNLHKLTGSPVVVVSLDDLKKYPVNPEIKMMADPVHNVLACSAVPTRQEEVIGPRRILLPR